MAKKYLILILMFIALAEGGYYVYQKQKPRADKRLVTIRVDSTPGVREGAGLAIAGVNATKDFSIRIRPGDENPIAAIESQNDVLILRINEGVWTIPRTATPSPLITGKIKSVYGHNILPWTAEAFDAVKLIAAGTSRIALDAPLDATSLRAVFKGLRGYTGESGAVQFDEQGVGRR